MGRFFFAEVLPLLVCPTGVVVVLACSGVALLRCPPVFM
jgi:hypothetical protein